MVPPSPQLRPGGLLALPGHVGALAVASASGAVAAGDDRGEAGVWEPDGKRRANLRFRSPVVGADVDADGARAAFVAADGECRIVRPGGETSLRVAPGDRVILDRAGRGSYVVSPATGAVESLDAEGRSTGRFEAPSPVAAAAAVPRSGGLAVVTRQGLVARLSPWGELLWGGDWNRYAGGIATDARGEVLVVCFLAHGAEVLQAAGGGRLGLLDVGRAVECASVSVARIALGCADGSVVVVDRAGRPVGEGRERSRVCGVGVVEGGVVFARTVDGTVRRWVPEGHESAARPARPSGGPASRIARHPIRHARATRPPALVAAGVGGDRVAVAAPERRVLLLDADGRTVAEGVHEGEMLALAVNAGGEALLATTDEVRCVAPGSDRAVRRLQLGLVAAAWAPGHGALVVSDEMGSVRLLDGATGQDLRRVDTPAGDGAARLFAADAGAAFQTRSGTIHTLRTSDARPLATRRAGTRPRLAGVGDDGPLVVSGGDRSGGDLLACGWEGEVRWAYRPAAAPSGFACLPGGRVVLVLPGRIQVLDREGRVLPPVRRPEGDLAAAGSGPVGDVLAWTDGRRVALSDLDGRTLVDETFDVKSLALAAAARGPLCAVLLDGGVAVLRPAAAVAG